MLSWLITLEIIIQMSTVNPTNWIWSTLKQGFSTSALLAFRASNSLVWEVVSGIIGCSAAFLSLLTRCQTPRPSCDDQKYSKRCQMSPAGQKHPWLRTTYTKLFTRSPKCRKEFPSTFIRTFYRNSLELNFQHLASANLHTQSTASWRFASSARSYICLFSFCPRGEVREKKRKP